MGLSSAAVCNTMQPVVTRCNALQHTVATHYNMVQNMLQHSTRKKWSGQSSTALGRDDCSILEARAAAADRRHQQAVGYCRERCCCNSVARPFCAHGTRREECAVRSAEWNTERLIDLEPAGAWESCIDFESMDPVAAESGIPDYSFPIVTRA
jgi:hypothetical protein